MSAIIENVYMGDIDDAYCVSKRFPDVTHLLTVNWKPLPIEVHSTLKYLYIHCLDTEDSDILTQLPECIDFIKEGRETGSVLVHCFAGQSRSGTVIVAFLMQHLGLDCSEALQYARKMRPSISPNEGFMKQLELFENMGNSVDLNSQLYRQHKIKLLSNQMKTVQSFGSIPDNCFVDLTATEGSSDGLFRCKICRKTLFKQSGVVQHSKRNGNVQYKHKQGKRQPSDTCNSYFIEPVLWMKETILEPSGKIVCHHCKVKIGSFDWSGDTCSCGMWVTPAFQISSARVDLELPKPAQNQPVRVTQWQKSME